MKKFFLIFLSFFGWDDGVKSAQRLDLNVTESKTVTAKFEKIEYVKVTYLAEEGGSVFGDISQTVELGNDCTQVYAIAEAGYRFVGWDDGIKSAQRLDLNVTENKTVTAKFESVLVQFYSEGNKVREYALSDFVTVDNSRVVGYSSFKVFDGWKFTGAYSGYNSYISGEPLDLIKTHFANQSDINDITLKAVYTESAEGDVISNSKTIAHALGGVNGKSYQNSKEAFETSYKKGFRFFEADVALTTDGVIVLDHARGQYTYDEFMNKASSGFTPLSLKNLFDYMVVYPEIRVDLDTLGFGEESEFNAFITSLKELVKNYNVELLDRIIVEITPWNEALIGLLKNEIGITNFLYTEVWDTNDLTAFEQSCMFCRENGIRFASLPVWGVRLLEEKVQLLKKYGIFIMFFTTSNIEDMYSLYDSGVDCIFTDFTFI